MKKIIIILLALTITISFASIKSYEQPLVVVIDAGHGGFDGGAVNGDILEKDLALSIALKTKALFNEVEIEVIMTRDSDKALCDNRSKKDDIFKRVDIINDSAASLFLSIHVNSFSLKSLKGAQTFFLENDSNELLAKKIQDNFKSILGNTVRHEKSINSVYLLKKANKPGCLIEAGFMSNEEELNLLTNEDYQDQIAKCIFYGTLEYLNS